jgi:hypothetical protein
MQPNYGPPPQAPPATVHGVPLEHGERVLLVDAKDHGNKRVVMLVFGVLFLPLLFGAIFLLLGLFYPSMQVYWTVLTNRRIIAVKGSRKWSAVPLTAIHRVVVENYNRMPNTIAFSGPQGTVRVWADARLNTQRGTLRIDEAVQQAQVPGFVESLPTVTYAP